MRSDVVISVKDLNKTYRIFGHPGDRIKQALSFGRGRFHRQFTALQDVSFEIKKGETLGIIGRNGSGKSTLLQLICGILKPTSGSVEVNGKIAALLELGAGFNPEFTGRENVYFQGAVLGLTNAEMDDCFADIAAFADIGEFIDQPVRMYSSGMYVRLAFAAAINAKSDILVVDEALSVGDAQFQAKCFAKFRSLQDKGVTILFVTHALELVAAHCDRVMLLDRGRLAKSGSAKVAIDEYRKLSTTHSKTGSSSPAGVNAKPHQLWAEIFQSNPLEVRYGSRDSEIIEAGIFTPDGNPAQLLHHGDECLIKIRVLNHQADLRPFISFVIKDLKGLSLCGTNTLLENCHLNPVWPGQTLCVVFRVSILLNPGNYLLSVGSQASGADGSSIAHDHRSDYLSFEVLGKPRYGIFAAPLTVFLEQE
jgi:ABC-type polysaccharide/polyol phosphate transport system ATPase subunit